MPSSGRANFNLPPPPKWSRPLVGSPSPAGFPGDWVSKESACNAGDYLQRRRLGFKPWIGGSPGGGNGNPFQCSCLGNPMDRAWWATVHGVSRVQHNLATKPPSPATLSEETAQGHSLTSQGLTSHTLHLQENGRIKTFTAVRKRRARSSKLPGFTGKLSRKETRVWGTSRGSASPGKATSRLSC